MAEIGDGLLTYKASRDCPSCKRLTNSEIILTINWVRVTCQECTLIRDLPRLPGVVR
jgi:hypothetical protein